MDIQSVEFSPATNDFIAQQLEAGAFHDEAELLEAAVDCLRANMEVPYLTPKVTFEEAAMAGIAEIEAGKGTLMTEERWNALIQQGIEQAKSGKPFRGDCAALPPL